VFTVYSVSSVIRRRARVSSALYVMLIIATYRPCRHCRTSAPFCTYLLTCGHNGEWRCYHYRDICDCHAAIRHSSTGYV